MGRVGNRPSIHRPGWHAGWQSCASTAVAAPAGRGARGGALACLCAALASGGAAEAWARSAPTAPDRVRFDTCSWDRPGHNPFSGDVVATVDQYPEIPAEVRQRLKARMEARQYDDIASIRRDSIDGRARYAPTLTRMHFGNNQVCESVTRTRWTEDMHERGLVYCEGEYCLIVPTVCRNVSRVTRLGPAVEAPPPVAVSSDGPIAFEPPAAGPPDDMPAGPGSPVDGLVPTSVPRPLAVPLVAAAPPTFAEAVFPRGPGGLVGGGGSGGGGGWRTPEVPVVPPPTPSPPPVPEPQTWLMMLAGLAGVVGLVRRRRR